MAKMSIPILVDWESIKDYLEMYDIVEVVRCKDCRYGNELCGNIQCENEYHGYDWFCPNGERKETEDEM